MKEDLGFSLTVVSDRDLKNTMLAPFHSQLLVLSSSVSVE